MDAYNAGRIVALAGDWHGRADWGGGRLLSLGAKGITTLLHVGDYGIWPGPLGKKYLTSMETVCARTGITILVTPGNHEDWDRIEGPMAKKPEDRGDGLGPVLWLTDHIAVLPRGHRFTLSADGCPDRTVVSLGGAPSVDFERRTEGVSWWPQEQIPLETAEKVAADGYADIFLAHDSPDHPWWTGGVEYICSRNDFGWSDRALAYAKVGRERLSVAFEGVRPRLYVHGHYHQFSTRMIGFTPDTTDVDCLMVSLDQNHTNKNVMLIDLMDLSLTGE